MKVKVAKRMYRMNREEYRKLLEIASEQVPFGIYAAEKKEYAELMNAPCQSRTQLKEWSRNLKSQGFKVYANGGNAS